MTERFTTDEKAIAVLTGTTMLVAGMWIGVWLVPDVALDVPTQTSYDGGRTLYSAMYTPVPNYLPGLSVLLVGAAVWGVRSWYTDGQDGDADDGNDVDALEHRRRRAESGAPADD